MGRHCVTWKQHGFRRSLLCLSALVLPAGCTRVHLASVANPFVSRAYSNIIVYFPVQNLQLRRMTEDTFAEAGGREVFLPAHGVGFPGALSSVEETEQFYARTGVEAILVISVSDSTFNPAFSESGTLLTVEPVPPASACWEPRDSGGPRDFGACVVFGAYSMIPQSGLTNSYRVVGTLYDATRGSAIWKGTMDKGHHRNIDWENLVRSFAKKVVERLTEDGMLRVPT